MPEDGGAVVQATETPREAAKTAAREELSISPEASRDEPEGAVSPPEQEQAAPEVDWSDATRREEYLKERYLPKGEHEARLKNQLSSLKGELELGRQAKVAEARDVLLTELDTLSREDPEGYAERLSKDSRAARAIADRTSQISPELLQQARILVSTDQARMLFAVRPEMEAMATDGGEDWSKAMNPETGGIFGHIQSTALEAGKTQGVEAYKKSPEFKRLIEEAERRGAHNALGEMEPIPSSNDGGVVPSADRKYDNPRQAAVAAAARSLRSAGRPVPAVDMALIGGRRA